jgi:molecular chaperone DnaK
MVIDFGGGTLDVNILEKDNDRIYEIAVGSEQIGGDDIDIELAKRVHTMFSDKAFEDISSSNKDQIRMACEEAKIRFTNNDEWSIELSNYGQNGIKTRDITYDWFKDVIDPILRNRAVHTIYDVMSKAHKNPESIDSVIIVGGSSNLRPFQEKVIGIFGAEKIIHPNENESQWAVARGAALMQFNNGQFVLGEDVAIELSDNSLYTILEKGKAHVGTIVDPISFKLIEDAQSANFIFKDGQGNLLTRKSIYTKGFLQENLIVKGGIDDDQIAEITISNKFMGNDRRETALINKLNFYYDLSSIKEVRRV